MQYAHRGSIGNGARRAHAFEGSPIDATLSLLADVDRPLISLAMGSPSPEAIPTEVVAQLAAQLLAGPWAVRSLDYAPTEGDPQLRAALLAWLARRGTRLDPDNLLVTSGAMQGLDLVARLFLEPGEVVAVESPSYANGLATFRNHGAGLLPIPVDSDGMRVDALAARIASGPERPTMVYTIPTFQNPSGVTMSLERRRALLALAAEHGLIVVEDDPYGELRYEGSPLPTLLELDGPEGRVIQVRTFSKIIAPGLRLGWVAGPAEAIALMVKVRQSMDTCSNGLAQGVVRLMLEQDVLDRHIEHLRRLYPRRRDAMLAEIGRVIPPDAGTAVAQPLGGMFLWLELPANIPGSAFAHACLERGVVVVPGSAFSVDVDLPAVRLCFTSVEERDVGTAVGGLADAFRSLQEGSHR